MTGLLIIAEIGWIVNVALFAIFMAIGLLAPNFWRRWSFWVAIAVPYFYLVLSVALAWEQIDSW